MILASGLRRKVKIQEAILTPDFGGGYSEEWEDVCSVSAGIEPVSATERLVAFKHESEISHRIMIRYRAGIKPDMRVMLGERVFSVLAVINVKERNERMVLLASEVVEV